MESEGFEEKHRAVIEGATLLMNRQPKWARSSLHYGGEGVLIRPSNQGVCGWRGVEDLCMTPGGLIEFSGGTEISDPTSESEMENDVL